MRPSIRPLEGQRKNILWLAAYPKSGSTWVRMFISAYLGDGTVDINKAEVGTGDANLGHYEAVCPVPMDGLRPAETFHLRRAMLFRIACSGTTVVKTHCCNGLVHGVEMIPPSLTKAAIYIVRDPRDVAISYADHIGQSVDEAIGRMGRENTMGLGGHILDYLGTWSDHVRSWIEEPPFPVLAVRYEELSIKPKEIFAHIARFLTGDVDEILLEKSIAAVDFKALRAQEDKASFVERSPHQKRFFRQGKSTWRDILTDEQAGRLARDHGHMIERIYGGSDGINQGISATGTGGRHPNG